VHVCDAGGVMSCWPHMEPQTLLHFTIKPSLLFPTGLYSV